MATDQRSSTDPLSNTARSTDWILDQDTTGLEVLRTPWDALVLVDRAPLEGPECQGTLDRKGLNGLVGTSLTLVGDIDWVEDDVMHGVYSGMMGGAAVLLDQYVQCLNGIPRVIVRVISWSNGPHAAANDLDTFVMKVIREV